MRYIKDYNSYKESIQFNFEYEHFDDLMESLNIWHDSLISSINAEEVNIFTTLDLPTDVYVDNLDIEFLSDNIEFINSLSSIGLKKSDVKNSDDFQTFLNKACKFMFIYDMNANELENPDYMLFQTWNSSLDRWEDAKMYKVNDDVKKFYEKLTSRSIEIIDGDERYIYQTSNGSEWDLQNTDAMNDIYLKTFRKDELQILLNERKAKVSII
jgi:hypothetical protein